MAQDLASFVHVLGVLNRMWTLLLLDGAFGKYWLDPADGCCCWEILYPYWLSVLLFYQLLRKTIKVFSVIVDLSISPFLSVLVPGVWPLYGLDTSAMHARGLMLLSLCVVSLVPGWINTVISACCPCLRLVTLSWKHALSDINRVSSLQLSTAATIYFPTSGCLLRSYQQWLSFREEFKIHGLQRSTSWAP